MIPLSSVVAMSVQNPPARHHYVPVFYLKQWAAQDGRLIEFSRPYGKKIVAQSVFPKESGFEWQLYSTDGVPHEDRHKIETEVMKPLDNDAAKALDRLYGHDTLWPEDERAGWSKFVFSLLTRGPEDIALLKDQLAKDYLTFIPELEQWYGSVREEHYPPTLVDFLNAERSELFGPFVQDILGSIFRGGEAQEWISGLDWAVIASDESRFEFITSDRPVIKTATLRKVGDYIILPIGPRRAFVGITDRRTKAILLRDGVGKLVKSINKTVAQQATKYIYASDESQRQFVENNMGRGKSPSLVRQMIASDRA